MGTQVVMDVLPGGMETVQKKVIKVRFFLSAWYDY